MHESAEPRREPASDGEGAAARACTSAGSVSAPAPSSPRRIIASRRCSMRSSQEDQPQKSTKGTKEVKRLGTLNSIFCFGLLFSFVPFVPFCGDSVFND